MDKIIKNENFKIIAESVKPDAKKRVVIPKVIPGIRYHIYTNDIGQLIFDPQITVPVSEAWFWNDVENVSAYKQATEDAAQGRMVRLDPAELED